MPSHRAEDLFGADDVLVFRRVGSRWTHLGGIGRGASWAGIVETHGDGDPRLEAALTSGVPVRRHGQRPHQVVGPYWAATSVVLRVDDQLAVVIGAAEPAVALLKAADAQLAQLAQRVAGTVTNVSPARHLADELEILTAVRDLATTAPATVSELLLHLAGSAAAALSCDLAAVWLDDRRHAVVVPGWTPRGGAQRAIVAARQLVPQLGADRDGPDWLVVQDASLTALPEPIGADDEVASYFALPLDVDGTRGCLLVVHSANAARGFTTVCQSLGAQLAQLGSRLLEVAATHDELVRQLDSSRVDAVHDPLTGAANRRGWDDAVRRAESHLLDGGSVAVVTVDIDDLKAVNDTHGHGAGDELIIECAQALGRAVREGIDMVARVGGDEFAVLIPASSPDPPPVAAEIATRLRAALTGVRTPSGLPLRTSLGTAICQPGQSLENAVQAADAAMYDDKRGGHYRR